MLDHCDRDVKLAAAAERATALQGLRIVDLYAKKGIEPSRLYIKVFALHVAFIFSSEDPIACCASQEIFKHIGMSTDTHGEGLFVTCVALA